MSAVSPSRRRLERHAYALVPIGLLAVLLVVAGVRGPDLFTSKGAADAIVNMGPLILATLALTPIAIAGRGGVDLSIGPLLGLVNVGVIAWLVNHGVTSPVLIFGFAIGIAVAFEVIQGVLIALLRLQPIIVTLSGFLVLGGLNLTIMGTPGGTAPGWLAAWGSPNSVLNPVLLVIVVSLILWVLVARSTFFRNIRLMGSNDRTAYASGVSITAARIGAHAISGVFAGIAGVLYTALIASGDPTFGSQYTLIVVTALLLGGISVAGGRGGALGAVVGAIDVFLISYVLATIDFGNSASYVVQLAYGLVLVAALGVGVVFGMLKARRIRREQSVEAAA